MPLTFDNSDGEIWFRPCRYDGTLESGLNPFTGESMSVPRNAPLTAKEERAVKALLAAARAKADKSGAPFDVFDERVRAGCMINPRGRVSPDLVALIHAVLVAGNWCFVADDAIVVASMDSVRGLPRPDPALPSGYPLIPSRVVVVASPQELAPQLGM